MAVRIEPIHATDRNEYERFIEFLQATPTTEQNVTFFHSWEWGQVLANRVERMERIVVRDGYETIAVGQLALHRDHGINYWYVPRGLAMDYTDLDQVGRTYEALRRYCRGLGGRIAFLRVDPNVPQGGSAEAVLNKLGARRAAVFHQAERCWITELHTTEDAQLAYMKAHGMRKDVFKRIKKSRNSGVTVRSSDDPKDLEELISMLHKLDTLKGGIGMHPDGHYRAQFSRLAPPGHQRLFVAEVDGEVCAINLMALYGGEASWLHGATATDPSLRRLSPAYQLHFETMRWIAQNRPEVRRYNFWGIVSDENYHKGHPRYGYSQFKRSFGGEKVEYMRAMEFPYLPARRAALFALDVYRTKRYQND